jgi:sugar/nucleoside kinase (ribokinase family)
VGPAPGIVTPARKLKKYVASGAGLVVLDLLVCDELDSIQAYAGGTCGNILAILAFLGWESYPIARLGGDAIGFKLRQDLRRFGVRENLLVIDSKVATPVIIQQNRRLPNGDISHRFVWRQCPQCGEYLQAFRPPTRAAADGLLDRLAAQNVFLFDRVAPSTIALAEASAARGALVVFEPSKSTQDRHFERALRVSHVVKYSRDRIAGLHRPRGWRPWLEVQTAGRYGLRYRISGKRWNDLKAVAAPGGVRDTSGAGDWTTAGLIDRLTRLAVPRDEDSDGAVRDALSYGQSLAAINCCYYGARGAMYELTSQAVQERSRRLIRGQSIRVRSGKAVLATDNYERVFCASCVDAVATP